MHMCASSAPGTVPACSPARTRARTALKVWFLHAHLHTHPRAPPSRHGSCLSGTAAYLGGASPQLPLCWPCPLYTWHRLSPTQATSSHLSLMMMMMIWRAGMLRLARTGARRVGLRNGAWCVQGDEWLRASAQEDDLCACMRVCVFMCVFECVCVRVCRLAQDESECIQARRGYNMEGKWLHAHAVQCGHAARGGVAHQHCGAFTSMTT